MFAFSLLCTFRHGPVWLAFLDQHQQCHRTSKKLKLNKHCCLNFYWPIKCGDFFWHLHPNKMRMMMNDFSKMHANPRYLLPGKIWMVILFVFLLFYLNYTAIVIKWSGCCCVVSWTQTKEDFLRKKKQFPSQLALHSAIPHRQHQRNSPASKHHILAALNGGSWRNDTPRDDKGCHLWENKNPSLMKYNLNGGKCFDWLNVKSAQMGAGGDKATSWSTQGRRCIRHW